MGRVGGMSAAADAAVPATDLGAVAAGRLWTNRYRHVTPFAVAWTASGAGGGSPKTDSETRRGLAFSGISVGATCSRMARS